MKSISEFNCIGKAVLILVVLIAGILSCNQQKENKELLSVQKELIATIKLGDSTYINNAPSGKDWSAYDVNQIKVGLAKDTITIDDSDTSKLTYFGNWTINSSSCNCSFSNNPGDSIVMRFTNTYRLEFWGEHKPGHGSADFFIDNKYIGTLNMDLDADPVHMVLAASSLDKEKVYTLKVVIKENKYFVHRFIRLITDSLAAPIHKDSIVWNIIEKDSIVWDIIQKDSIIWDIIHKDSTLYNYEMRDTTIYRTEYKDTVIYKFDTVYRNVPIDSIYTVPIGDTIQLPPYHLPPDTIPGDTIHLPPIEMPGDTLCIPCPPCPEIPEIKNTSWLIWVTGVLLVSTILFIILYTRKHEKEN